MIIDGGMVGMGLESTIIDVTVGTCRFCARFNTKMLKEVIDRSETDKAILTKKPTDGLRPKAPRYEI